MLSIWPKLSLAELPEDLLCLSADVRVLGSFAEM